jgi:osmotically-inducible protein OsmY
MKSDAQLRTPAERDSAASLADQVKGVMGVSNRIHVTGPETMEVESPAHVAGWQPIDQEC